MGEADSGQRSVAAHLHKDGMRWGPFVRVDVAAHAEDTLGEVLFGAAADPATGAPARTGAFVQAHNGTLLLESIEHLRPQQQVWLMRAIDERVVRPPGGEAQVHVDVRVICTTSADIRELVQGPHLPSLLRLLRSHEIRLPPLRRRRADFIGLADAACPPPAGHASWSSALSAAAAALLLLHDWPGNLAELQAVLTRVKTRLQGATADPATLPPELRRAVRARIGDGDDELPPTITPPSRISRAETRPDADVLRHLMVRHEGNLGAVARELRAHRPHVYRWLDYAGVARDHGKYE